MKIKSILAVASISIFLMLCLCGETWRIISDGNEGVVIRGGSGGKGCILPPETFQESDLIGTWKAGLSEYNDTLILRGDGKYKQILEVQGINYFYESDWLNWWVEYSEGSTPYVHLEGMHLCIYNISDDCKTEGGGDDGWYNFCEETIVDMQGKGILVVLGNRSGSIQSPRGINMIGFKKDPDVGGWAYKLQE